MVGGSGTSGPLYGVVINSGTGDAVKNGVANFIIAPDLTGSVNVKLPKGFDTAANPIIATDAVNGDAAKIALAGDGAEGNEIYFDDSTSTIRVRKASAPGYWSDESVRATEFAGGDGNSSENAYQISTAEQLGYMAYLINNEWSTYKAKHYKLMADINLNGHQWMPMGSSSGAFMGTFDGGEYTIINMNIAVNGNMTKDRFAGLFGKIYDGTVQNVTIGEGSEVTVNYTGSTGSNGYDGVVGGASNKSTIENCHSSASVSATFTDEYINVYVGGVIGYLEKGTVKNCSNSGTVGGTAVVAGGVAGGCGDTYAGTIQNCWNTGDISVDGTSSYAGGIVGHQIHEDSIVKNCYNAGNIEGKKEMSYYGGVAGCNYGTIENCYSAGILDLPDSKRMSAGGLVGSNSDFWNKGKAINSYWRKDTDVNAALSSVGESGTETNVLSFDNTGTFTESSSITIGSQPYSSLLPALNAWVTAQSGSYWFWTGDAAAPTLTKDAPPATYAVTVDVNKDNVTWPDHGKVFKLVSGETTVTNLGSVESGTYDVYEGDTDTGVDVTVSNAAESVTVDYYTVTFYDGNTAYTSGTPQAPQIVLKNGKATGPEAPTKANYIFNNWVTEDGGNTAFDFINATITAAASVYASWTSDPSTAVTVTLSTDTNAPYYNGSSLTLTAKVTMQSTEATVTTGTVQFYRGDEMLGNEVSYTNEGDASGFCLTVVCGTSNSFPFLAVGDNEVKAVYTSASGSTSTESNTVTLNVSDKKDGNQYLGSTQLSTTYNGSTEGNCVVQFNITHNGGEQQITAGQLEISGQKNNQAFSDFSVTYNDANTVASVYVKKPGTYTFTATLNNHSYVAEETATGTISPAPLVITPNDLTIAVGETPEFSYTSNGLKGEDKITNITYITTANGNYSQAGQYDISIGDITMDNADCYTIEKKTAKLTVKVHTTITASAGAGGTISPSGIVSVSSGESQSFTISANSGYHIDSVIVDGVNQGAVSTYTFSNVTENHTISAAFSRNSSGGGGGGGGSSSSSSSSSSSPATTTTSTTTTEDGGQVTTSVTTDPTTGQTVTTEVKKDAAGNITGAQASVGTSGTSTSVTNGQAQISTAVDGNLVNQAVNAAGSPIPVGISVGLPNQELAAQFNNPEVQNVTVNLTIPDTVTDNGKMTVNNITIDKATIEAAKAAGKDLTVTVKDEKSNINYVWTINGQELKASTAPVTDINLALIITPVKKLSGEKESIKAVVAGMDAELKGLNLHFSHTGTLPSVIRVRIPSGNEAGISPGDVVYLYYYNPVSKSLEALSGNQYTVEADGFITIRLTHCSDYVLLPKKVEVPQVKQEGKQVHTIKKGDTLNTISQQYGCTVADIMASNPGLDIYDLRVGSGLNIPGKQ